MDTWFPAVRIRRKTWAIRLPALFFWRTALLWPALPTLILAGRSEKLFVDQIQVLDVFDADFGKPKQTIAWGHSLGGIITAGLVQNNPGRFTAAQPMCSVLAGGVATWNAALDGEFAFKTLLAPNSDLQLVNITTPII